jgi:hypothetical protein
MAFQPFSRYSGFFRPEKAKFRRQSNPKFQSGFVLLDRAS